MRNRIQTETFTVGFTRSGAALGGRSAPMSAGALPGPRNVIGVSSIPLTALHTPFGARDGTRTRKPRDGQF